MSRRELVVLVSRALALLFISSAFIEATCLPERLFALSHYVKQNSAVVGPTLSSNYYLVLTVCLVLRIVVYSLAATLFWKCGPLVERLLSIHSELVNE